MDDEPECAVESSDDGDVDVSDHGVGRKYLESLPPGSVVAYRGEPSAVELSLLRYSMNEDRQLRFDSAISDLVHGLRAMSSQERASLLSRLSAAAVADDVAVPIETDDLPFLKKDRSLRGNVGDCGAVGRGSRAGGADGARGSAASVGFWLCCVLPHAAPDQPTSFGATNRQAWCFSARGLATLAAIRST